MRKLTPATGIKPHSLTVLLFRLFYDKKGMMDDLSVQEYIHFMENIILSAFFFPKTKAMVIVQDMRYSVASLAHSIGFFPDPSLLKAGNMCGYSILESLTFNLGCAFSFFYFMGGSLSSSFSLCLSVYISPSFFLPPFPLPHTHLKSALAGEVPRSLLYGNSTPS